MKNRVTEYGPRDTERGEKTATGLFYHRDRTHKEPQTTGRKWKMIVLESQQWGWRVGGVWGGGSGRVVGTWVVRDMSGYGCGGVVKVRSATNPAAGNELRPFFPSRHRGSRCLF